MQMYQLTVNYKGEYRPTILYFVHANNAREEKNKVGNGNIEVVNIKGLKQNRAFDGMTWNDIAYWIKN